MRVALVHYWLKSERGGEKVLRALCDLFPDAVIFTHSANEQLTKRLFAGHEIRQSFISKLPFAKKHSEKYLPLMPLALEALDLQEFDLVVSSESGPAKGVVPRPDALHVCYCHTPMRYIWDKYHVYRSSAGPLAKLIMPVVAHRMRQWDVVSAARVDHFIANSQLVANRIEKYYRRASEIVHPPIDVRSFISSSDRLHDDAYNDAYLWVGELVPYKRPDIAIEAFTRMKRRLIVIGDGPELRKLKRVAGDTISFLGRVEFDVLRSAYASCKALIFPGVEDFGIVPVEAMASGAPVIAFGRGGALDTVVHNKTGLLYERGDVDGLIDAVERFDKIADAFDPLTMQAHAATFSEAAFKAKLTALFAKWGAPIDGMGVSDAAIERSRETAVG